MLDLPQLIALCFVTCYALAWVLAALQVAFRSATRGGIIPALVLLGLIAHTVFLTFRAITATAAPLSSPFDWNLLAAWAVVVAYLYLSWYHRNASLGLFLLPIALALIGLAHFADHEPFARSAAGQVWGMIHGILWLLGAVAVLIGFVAGVMYLLQSYRLKHKSTAAARVRLPSLEWLERINSRAIVVSVLMVGAGFLSGIILNVVLRERKLEDLPWSDPVVWRSALMFGWLLAAAVFSAVYRPARSGRKVAYLTVASFAFLAMSLAIRVALPSEHGAPRESTRESAVGFQRPLSSLEVQL